jgi:hypothetical protein
MSPPVTNAPCPCQPPATTDQREQRRHSPPSSHPAISPERTLLAGHGLQSHVRFERGVNASSLSTIRSPWRDGRTFTDQEIADESSHRIHHLRSACRSDQIRNQSRNKQLGPIRRARPSVFLSVPPIPPPSSLTFPSLDNSPTPRAARALPTSSLCSLHTIFTALARYGLRPLIPRPFLAPLGPRLATHLLGGLTAGSAKNGLRTLLERKMLGSFFETLRVLVVAIRALTVLAEGNGFFVFGTANQLASKRQ